MESIHVTSFSGETCSSDRETNFSRSFSNVFILKLPWCSFKIAKKVLMIVL